MWRCRPGILRVLMFGNLFGEPVQEVRRMNESDTGFSDVLAAH